MSKKLTQQNKSYFFSFFKYEMTHTFNVPPNWNQMIVVTLKKPGLDSCAITKSKISKLGRLIMLYPILWLFLVCVAAIKQAGIPVSAQKQLWMFQKSPNIAYRNQPELNNRLYTGVLICYKSKAQRDYTTCCRSNNKNMVFIIFQFTFVWEMWGLWAGAMLSVRANAFCGFQPKHCIH